MEANDVKNVSTKIRCAGCGCETLVVILLPEVTVSNATNVISLPSKTKTHRTAGKNADPKRPPSSNPLGGQVARLRTAKGWSVYDLSKQSGIAAMAIKKIEAGVPKTIRDKTISKLAKALDISPEELKHPKLRVVPPGASGRPEGR